MKDHKPTKLAPDRGITKQQIYKTHLHGHGDGMHRGDSKPPKGVVRGEGIPMIGGQIKKKPEPKNCSANEGTCKAFRVKGEKYCYGHLRSMEKVGSGDDTGSS